MVSLQTKKSMQIQDPTEWVDLYGDMLLSYALARISDRGTAEDLVQETFLAAWKSRNNYAGKSRFSTWLISILRNKITDHYRSNPHTKSLPINEAENGSTEDPTFGKRGKWNKGPKSWSVSPEELVENREFWKTVALCLGDMPAHLAYVFRLRELKAANTKEICTLLEISSANVSVRLHRARLLLRQCLETKWFV